MKPIERAAIEQKIEVFEEKISALREQLRPDASEHLEYTPTSEREGLARAIRERCGAMPDGTMSPKDINDAVLETMAQIRNSPWETR